MKRILRFSLVLFVICLILVAAGKKEKGAGEKAAGKGVIYDMAPLLWDEFQAGSKLMIEKFAKELGYEIKSLNAGNNATNQIVQMDDIIPLKPTAIILNAVDSSTIVGSVEKARAEGIPVLVYDRFITETKVDFHSVVGTIKMGEMGADECAKFLKTKYGKEKGVVLEIMGDTGDMYTILIDQGFKDRIGKKYPNIETIVKDTPQWEPTVAARVADDQLTARKDIDIIFLHSDARATAIVPVLESHGYKKGDVILIGTDGSPTSLDTIRNGWMQETIAVPMVQQAWGLYEFLDDILAGKQIKPGKYNIKGIESELINEKWGPTLYLPGEILKKDNIENPDLWGNLKVEVEE
jgi:ribose transport system substrate-binding protein